MPTRPRSRATPACAGAGLHTDHLGSVAVITDETGIVKERLSYDAWGMRRHPDGTPDPSGSIASQSTRGFTGHEHLADVGLIHMNGRVYDPLLARFGTPDPMTESPFSTQGWNRYTYVGNSPVNFTDPSGYCFLGCFWKPIFKAIGKFFKQSWGAILQITVTGLCHFATGPNPGCAALGSFVSGITSGDLGMAVRGAAIAFITASAFSVVGKLTAGNFAAKVAGHAGVGCLSSLAQGGPCGAGALSAAVSAARTPFVNEAFPNPLGNSGDFVGGTTASALLGGLGSVAGGGKFANGAVTAAYGYLFNQLGEKYRTRDDSIRTTSPLDDALIISGVGLGFRALWTGLRAALAGLAGTTGFSSIEMAVINEVRGISLAELRAAFQAGGAELSIAGRTIVVEPGMSASGMTLFGENGFVLGRAAFASNAELRRTLLHEIYRLNTSQAAAGVSGAPSAVGDRRSCELCRPRV